MLKAELTAIPMIRKVGLSCYLQSISKGKKLYALLHTLQKQNLSKGKPGISLQGYIEQQAVTNHNSPLQTLPSGVFCSCCTLQPGRET